MPIRVTPRQIGRVFARGTRAGAASRAPTGKKSTEAEEVNRAISDLKFEIKEQEKEIPQRRRGRRVKKKTVSYWAVATGVGTCGSTPFQPTGRPRTASLRARNRTTYIIWR